jgi:hypothetical protein
MRHYVRLHGHQNLIGGYQGTNRQDAQRWGVSTSATS